MSGWTVKRLHPRDEERSDLSEADARALFAEWRTQGRTMLLEGEQLVMIGSPTKYELQGADLRAERARAGMHVVR